MNSSILLRLQQVPLFPINSIDPLVSFFFPKSRPPFHPFKPSRIAPNLTTTSRVAGVQLERQPEVQVTQDLTMTQFCDKMIDLFMNQKPRTKDWRKYLLFRDEWKKYRESFYSRCQTRACMETDPLLNEKLAAFAAKFKKIDDQMETHTQLFQEIEDNPTDINAIVANRRKDFDADFFRHLTLLQQTHDNLDDRDAVARLAARCLSALSAYDNTLQIVETFDTAQAKFNDILSSPTIDAACEKVKSLAKGKQLDSSLILLISSTWANAKASSTMKNEVKEIMHRIYKTMKSSLRSITPKEIKLVKHLLNITDPEERFSALASAFCPGGEHETKDPNALYTTPKELLKWIKIMLEAYNLSQEETDIREAKKINDPVVIQRLIILKETIEEEYLEREVKTDAEANKSESGYEEF